MGAKAQEAKDTVYQVKLISMEEKGALAERCGLQVRYEVKSEIYGCCIKLLTGSAEVRDRWMESFYFISQNIRSHARLYVVSDPVMGDDLVFYDPQSKTAFLVNVTYYGWIKSLALSAAGDVLEDQHGIYSVHGACLDLRGPGLCPLGGPGAGKPPPTHRLRGGPRTRVVARGGVRLGFVFSPVGAKPGAEPDAKARAATVAAAREMRGAADLVVGVSPWGSMAEEAFLTANPDVFDVLLGAGHGFGTPAMPQPVPRTLWARAHTKGRTISRLDIVLPVKKAGAPWLPGEDHQAELLNPDYTVPGDPDIAILGETPTVAATTPKVTTATP